MLYKAVVDKTILIKVTSRGRKSELLKCVHAAHSLADNPTKLKWLFSFDYDDEGYTDKTFINELYALGNVKAYFGVSNSKIHAINRDIKDYSKMNEWDILVNLSDDQLCEFKGWDSVVRETMPNDLDASIWAWDGRQPRLNTMEIVGRNYYNRFGYIYYPEYKSFYCDNEAHEVAESLGKLIKVKDCLFKHYHVGWAKETHMKHDETYKRAEKHWAHDEQLFKQRKQTNFGCKA